ncbi:unnamed protein product [Clonostachys rosea]|uniref:Uncharacterized protein n=1 Tax=Bionectria ochroleuca TaxID=29856 RepID=A0ABY6U902_BIOOC|nr:unnamed protein product [Clonostachys rosea]
MPPGKLQYVRRFEVLPKEAVVEGCYHDNIHGNLTKKLLAYDTIEKMAGALRWLEVVCKKALVAINASRNIHFYDWIAETASALGDGRLEIFRWEMGTCVPGSLLGTNGVISLKQNSLRRLILVTASPCYIGEGETFHNGKPNQVIDLSAFRMLEQIDWTAPNAVFIPTLSLAIKQNAGHLRRLHLHFDNWQSFETNIRETKFLADLPENEAIEAAFAHRFFNVPSPKQYPTRHLFPELRDLFLSDVPLSGELANAIDFKSLRSLRIYLCPGWDQFLLRSLSELKEHEKLKTLEIGDNWTEPATVQSILNKAIRTVKRLETLFLNHLAPVGTLKMWENITYYQKDLRHFVHQQYKYDEEEATKAYEERRDLDLGDLSLPSKELIHQQFSGLNLESIGLSCEPEYFVSNFYITRTWMYPCTDVHFAA